MAQERPQEGVSQAPQVSEEEMEKLRQKVAQLSEEDQATLRLTIRLRLLTLSIKELGLTLSGCLTYSEDKKLRSWYNQAEEALDRKDLAMAIEWYEKIVNFHKEKEEACSKPQKPRKNHSKRYSRQSSRH